MTKRLRLTLTNIEHERMNRFRNNVNLWLGYAIILLLGFAGLMLFVGLAIRLTMWALR